MFARSGEGKRADAIITTRAQCHQFAIGNLQPTGARADHGADTIGAGQRLWQPGVCNRHAHGRHNQLTDRDERRASLRSMNLSG